MNSFWEFDGFLYLGRGGGHWVDFPYDSKKEFGSLKPVRVNAWFDGICHRTSLAPKGDGDIIHVRIEPDKKPRDPGMPEDLQWLLENEPEAMKIFNNLSASTKKYLLESVVNAKTDETRVNNINKFFEFLNKRK